MARLVCWAWTCCVNNSCLYLSTVDFFCSSNAVVASLYFLNSSGSLDCNSFNSSCFALRLNISSVLIPSDLANASCWNTSILLMSPIDWRILFCSFINPTVSPLYASSRACCIFIFLPNKTLASISSDIDSWKFNICLPELATLSNVVPSLIASTVPLISSLTLPLTIVSVLPLAFATCPITTLIGTPAAFAKLTAPNAISWAVWDVMFPNPMKFCINPAEFSSDIPRLVFINPTNLTFSLLDAMNWSPNVVVNASADVYASLTSNPNCAKSLDNVLALASISPVWDINNPEVVLKSSAALSNSKNLSAVNSTIWAKAYAGFLRLLNTFTNLAPFLNASPECSAASIYNPSIFFCILNASSWIFKSCSFCSLLSFCQW